MEDLTVEKINIMAGTYDRLIEQNRELQEENRILKQQLEKNKLSSILTKREYEVLGLIAQGLTNKEIADRLCIEMCTVRTHINCIYQKLEFDPAGCRSAARVQAALKYQANNPDWSIK